MLYSDTKKFIFVHIYKTGGESVVEGLRRYCPVYFSSRHLNKTIRLLPSPANAVMGWREELVRRQHMTAEQIRNAMPREAFDETYKFAFVRNPWDWQVSIYFYSRQSKAHPEHEKIVNMKTFDDYIRYRVDHDVRLQRDYIYDSAGEKLVDYVGRFENLSGDFDSLARNLGVEAKLPHKNASKRKKDWRSYYTDKTFDMVKTAFREDIETFNYSDTSIDSKAKSATL